MRARAKRLESTRAAEARHRAAYPAVPSQGFAQSAAWARLGDDLLQTTDLDRQGVARVLQVVEGALAELQRELDARARQIVEQQHFIEQVVNALPVGLYVVDREYRVQAWNHTREVGLQGIARGEALGRTIFEVLHRQPAESLRREFDLVFATGELCQFEAESRALSADGKSPRTYRISKIPLRLDGNEVTHVITVGEDVTRWKEAEARVAQSEKLAAIGQLAAGVMHEINNPLATIAACAESMTLQLEPLAQPGAGGQPIGADLPIAQHVEYLRVIDAEVRRCKGIAEALLNFSRARPGDGVPVDLNGVVEQTMFLLKHHRRFQHQVVELELAREVPMVRGNAEQLVQVFMALLHNAADAVEDGRHRAAGGQRRPAPRRSARRQSHGAGAMRGSGTITVRTQRVDGNVVAEVIDGGAGIPRNLQSKIFEPFFTTKPIGRGTGLGLAVCYGIVADHGGRLEVQSEVGVGSTFRIVLPSAATQSARGVNGGRNLEGAEA